MEVALHTPALREKIKGKDAKEIAREGLAVAQGSNAPVEIKNIRECILCDVSFQVIIVGQASVTRKFQLFIKQKRFRVLNKNMKIKGLAVLKLWSSKSGDNVFYEQLPDALPSRKLMHSQRKDVRNTRGV